MCTQTITWARLETRSRTSAPVGISLVCWISGQRNVRSQPMYWLKWHGGWRMKCIRVTAFRDPTISSATVCERATQNDRAGQGKKSCLERAAPIRRYQTRNAGKESAAGLAHGVTQPDLGSNFQSPSDSPGQKALKAYWRI